MPPVSYCPKDMKVPSMPPAPPLGSGCRGSSLPSPWQKQLNEANKKIFLGVFFGLIGLVFFVVVYARYKKGYILKVADVHPLQVRDGRLERTHFTRRYFSLGFMEITKRDRQKAKRKRRRQQFRKKFTWKSTHADYSWVWWDPGGVNAAQHEADKKALSWIPKCFRSYPCPTADSLWNDAQGIPKREPQRLGHEHSSMGLSTILSMSDVEDPTAGDTAATHNGAVTPLLQVPEATVRRLSTSVARPRSCPPRAAPFAPAPTERNSSSQESIVRQVVHAKQANPNWYSVRHYELEGRTHHDSDFPEALGQKLKWLNYEFSAGRKMYNWSTWKPHPFNLDMVVGYDGPTRGSERQKRLLGDPRFRAETYGDPAFNGQTLGNGENVRYAAPPARERADTPEIKHWRSSVNKYRQARGTAELLRSIELFDGSAEEAREGRLDTATYILRKPRLGYDRSSAPDTAYYEGVKGWFETGAEWKKVKVGHSYTLKRYYKDGRNLRPTLKKYGRRCEGTATGTWRVCRGPEAAMRVEKGYTKMKGYRSRLRSTPQERLSEASIDVADTRTSVLPISPSSSLLRGQSLSPSQPPLHPSPSQLEGVPLPLSPPLPPLHPTPSQLGGVPLPPSPPLPPLPPSPSQLGGVALPQSLSVIDKQGKDAGSNFDREPGGLSLSRNIGEETGDMEAPTIPDLTAQMSPRLTEPEVPQGDVPQREFPEAEVPEGEVSEGEILEGEDENTGIAPYVPVPLSASPPESARGTEEDKVLIPGRPVSTPSSPPELNIRGDNTELGQIRTTGILPTQSPDAADTLRGFPEERIEGREMSSKDANQSVKDPVSNIRSPRESLHDSSRSEPAELYVAKEKETAHTAELINSNRPEDMRSRTNDLTISSFSSAPQTNFHLTSPGVTEAPAQVGEHLSRHSSVTSSEIQELFGESLICEATQTSSMLPTDNAPAVPEPFHTEVAEVSGSSTPSEVEPQDGNAEPRISESEEVSRFAMSKIAEKGDNDTEPCVNARATLGPRPSNSEGVKIPKVEDLHNDVADSPKLEGVDSQILGRLQDDNQSEVAQPPVIKGDDPDSILPLESEVLGDAAKRILINGHGFLSSLTHEDTEEREEDGELPDTVDGIPVSNSSSSTASGGRGRHVELPNIEEPHENLYWSPAHRGVGAPSAPRASQSDNQTKGLGPTGIEGEEQYENPAQVLLPASKSGSSESSVDMEILASPPVATFPPSSQMRTPFDANSSSPPEIRAPRSQTHERFLRSEAQPSIINPGSDENLATPLHTPETPMLVAVPYNPQSGAQPSTSQSPATLPSSKSRSSVGSFDNEIAATPCSRSPRTRKRSQITRSLQSESEQWTTAPITPTRNTNMTRSVSRLLDEVVQSLGHQVVAEERSSSRLSFRTVSNCSQEIPV